MTSGCKNYYKLNKELKDGLEYFHKTSINRKRDAKKSFLRRVLSYCRLMNELSWTDGKKDVDLALGTLVYEWLLYQFVLLKHVASRCELE